MISAGAKTKLAELLRYHHCLEDNGLYRLNSAAETLGFANGAQLEMIANAVLQGNTQAEAFIDSLYQTALPAMKIAYMPYEWTQCLERKKAEEGVIGTPAPDMTKTVLIVAAIGLGAWWYFSQRK